MKKLQIKVTYLSCIKNYYKMKFKCSKMYTNDTPDCFIFFPL